MAVDIGAGQARIVVDRGPGPLVVLCSALGGSPIDWDDTVGCLAADHTVIRFDWPEMRPASPATPGRPLSVRGEADRIAAVLDALGAPEPVVVVGHSLGGLHAEGFARVHPHRTSALLLLDSSIAETHRPWLPRRARLAAADTIGVGAAALRVHTLMIRAGLSVIHRRRPAGLDQHARAEIRYAATDPGFLTAVLREYAAYPDLCAELWTLRATRPLPPVARRVVTADLGRRTHRWRTRQIQLAHLLGAEHTTINPAHHHVMIEHPDLVADLIRQIAR
jgi:pimeloyl-ACP methyl ester carboxylesterase